MIFMIIFTMEYIRLLGSSVDPILVAMTSYLMVPIVSTEATLPPLKHIASEIEHVQ